MVVSLAKVPSASDKVKRPLSLSYDTTVAVTTSPLASSPVTVPSGVNSPVAPVTIIFVRKDKVGDGDNSY